MSGRKAYLGDGVYIDTGPMGELVLTTEDGVTVTNRIVIESPVYEALQLYVSRLREHDGD